MRETHHQLVASHMYSGTGNGTSNPGTLPLPGMEPMTLQFPGRCSNFTSQGSGFLLFIFSSHKLFHDFWRIIYLKYICSSLSVTNITNISSIKDIIRSILFFSIIVSALYGVIHILFQGGFSKSCKFARWLWEKLQFKSVTQNRSLVCAKWTNHSLIHIPRKDTLEMILGSSENFSLWISLIQGPHQYSAEGF